MCSVFLCCAQARACLSTKTAFLSQRIVISCRSDTGGVTAIAGLWLCTKTPFDRCFLTLAVLGQGGGVPSLRVRCATTVIGGIIIELDSCEPRFREVISCTLLVRGPPCTRTTPWFYGIVLDNTFFGRELGFHCFGAGRATIHARRTILMCMAWQYMHLECKLRHMGLNLSDFLRTCVLLYHFYPSLLCTLDRLLTAVCKNHPLVLRHFLA